MVPRRFKWSTWTAIPTPSQYSPSVSIPLVLDLFQLTCGNWPDELCLVSRASQWRNDRTLTMGLRSSRSKSELCRPKFVVKSPEMLSYVARNFITLPHFPLTLILFSCNLTGYQALPFSELLSLYTQFPLTPILFSSLPLWKYNNSSLFCGLFLTTRGYDETPCSWVGTRWCSSELYITRSCDRHWGVS